MVHICYFSIATHGSKLIDPPWVATHTPVGMTHTHGSGCGLASETHGFTHADHYPDAGDPTSPFSHPLPKAQVSGRQGIITTHKVKITRFGSHSGCSLTLEAVAGKEPSA